MYEYKLTKGEYIVEGIKHIGYGISLAPSAVSFSDITVDREEAARFVKLCNDMQLSPIHLDEVVEDFLAGGFVE